MNINKNQINLNAKAKFIYKKYNFPHSNKLHKLHYITHNCHLLNNILKSNYRKCRKRNRSNNY